MDFYFLLCSLFFPRLTMVWYFVQGWFPANSVPFIGDVLLGVFVPRVLVLIYIYQNMGYENIWFAAHILAMVLTYFGGGKKASGRYWRKDKE